MGSSRSATDGVPYAPKLRTGRSRQALDRFARRVRRVLGGASPEGAEAALRRLLSEALEECRKIDREDRSTFEASLRVLTDLALQGWSLSVGKEEMRLGPPAVSDGDALAEKARIRRQEHLKRNEQLESPAVRKFVTDMERRRIFGARFVSIYSLFRDGRELADQLRRAREAPAPERLARLSTVIDPHLVFFDEEDRCPHTGLRLMDIWRYFRHTWANQYTSVPGRTMLFLVRDRAAEDHPILGIGAVGSPIMQIRERDTWIGWHPETLLGELARAPSGRIGLWLSRVVTAALEEIYVQDFLEESEDGRLLTPAQLRAPTEGVIGNLRAHSEVRRRRHQQFPDPGEHKTKGDWGARARTNLYASKRALALANLLEARMVLERFLSARPKKAEVAALAADRAGRRAILRIARKAKADRVGIAMADITVCGAIPPYGPLVAGKLVSMLAASPELVAAYRARYGGAESEIASQMAGRPIRRPADLVFLGTTSLYGRSAQYNRVRVPADRLGGAPDAALRFIPLGESEAYGTSHYSAGTVRAFDDVLRQSAGGKRVNYIFGEGTSPKLRKVRDGLIELGFPADLLRHHRRRVLYGVPLISNLRDYLLGMDAKPRYLFKATGDAATRAIAEWWRERWLARRIESDEVLDGVEQHALTWPIQHGARVQLPPEDPNQLNLFEDLDGR